MYFDEVKNIVSNTLIFTHDNEVALLADEAKDTTELIKIVHHNTNLSEQETINYIIACI